MLSKITALRSPSQRPTVIPTHPSHLTRSLDKLGSRLTPPPVRQAWFPPHPSPLVTSLIPDPPFPPDEVVGQAGHLLVHLVEGAEHPQLFAGHGQPERVGRAALLQQDRHLMLVQPLVVQTQDVLHYRLQTTRTSAIVQRAQSSDPASISIRRPVRF